LVFVTRTERLDKLDNAFLFIISVLGLFVTIIQTYLSGTRGLIEALPLLVLGIPIPFYIGYIRGAISISQPDKQIVERLRGWAYLTVGVGAYVSLIWENPLFMFTMVPLSFLSIYYLQKWFTEIFALKSNLSYQIAVYGSATSAFLLAFISRLSVIMLNLDQSPFPAVSYPLFLYSMLLGIWIITLTTSVFLTIEKFSRMMMNVQLPLGNDQIQKRLEGNFFYRFSRGLMDLAIIIVGTNRKATIIWLLGLFSALPAVVIAQPTLLADKPWLILLIFSVFISTSIVLALIGTIHFLKTQKLNVSKLWVL